MVIPIQIAVIKKRLRLIINQLRMYICLVELIIFLNILENPPFLTNHP